MTFINVQENCDWKSGKESTRKSISVCVCVLKVWWPSYILLVHAGGGGSALWLIVLVLQSNDEDLDRLLHKLLPVVWEQQVVVGNAIAHRVIRTHHVDQRSKQRQGVPRDCKVKKINK